MKSMVFKKGTDIYPVSAAKIAREFLDNERYRNYKAGSPMKREVVNMMNEKYGETSDFNEERWKEIKDAIAERERIFSDIYK
jgi:hypothetical protein